MATKDSIMKQSIFFWVIEHRLSFEYGLKKFLFGAWRNLSGALRELILRPLFCLFLSGHLKQVLLYVRLPPSEELLPFPVVQTSNPNMQ